MNTSAAGRVKVAVSGLYGRMGSRVIELLEEGIDPEVVGVAGVVREAQHENVSRNLPVSINAKEAMSAADVLIEFTNPAATVGHLAEIAAMGKTAVVGTTGFTAQEWKKVQEISARMAIVYDTNFSLGIAVLRRALGLSLKDVQADMDCSIVEVHRKGKKDVPSGTAKDLADLMVGAVGEKPDVFSLRLGEVPGEHKVYLATPYEVLEFGHRVYSRDAFATGAIYAAKWVYGQKPGLYRFSDVLGFKKEIHALAG